MPLVSEYTEPDETMGEAVYRFAQEIVTEERTDTLIAVIVEALPLPWGTRGLVRRILDWMLPAKFHWIVREFLQRIGQLPSDRALHPENPFR